MKTVAQSGDIKRGNSDIVQTGLRLPTGLYRRAGAEAKLHGLTASAFVGATLTVYFASSAEDKKKVLEAARAA